MVAGLDGAPQDALGPLVEVAGERDTDAGRHLGHTREDDRGVGDAHGDALAQRLRGRTVGDVTAHEHEPLAVHVGDDVPRAGDRPQSLRDRLEQVGARGVAEAFLHEVEVVELHRHDRQAAQVHVPEGEPGAEPVEVEDRDAGGAGIALGAGRHGPGPVRPDGARGGVVTNGSPTAGASTSSGAPAGGGSATGGASSARKGGGASNPGGSGSNGARAGAGSASPVRGAASTGASTTGLSTTGLSTTGLSTTGLSTTGLSTTGGSRSRATRSAARRARRPARHTSAVATTATTAATAATTTKEFPTIPCRSRGRRA